MMKTLRTTLSILAVGLIATISPSAQTAVAPPPEPADSGPSLAVTMKFIQDKLNQQGEVTFVLRNLDAPQDDPAVRYGQESNHVIADPAVCRISYHRHETMNEVIVAFDRDLWFDLRDVERLEVRTGQQHFKKVYPTYNYRTDPPIFVLVAREADNKEFEFNFTEEEMADRVAKAMVHAVELCGGGNKDPF
jgi:hypothetical protein